jgi:hypothetical protein
MSIDEMTLREEIAREIEHGVELLLPPTNEVEQAVYETLVWAAGIARGEDNYMTKLFETQVDFE